MSYTTKGQPQGLAYIVTNKIREAMIAEIVAINGYAAHIASSHMEEINAAWRAIMQDEKDHYGMFMALLRRYDPEEYAKYEKHQLLKCGWPERLQPYKADYDRQLILNNLREDIKGELEAVILYEQIGAECPFADVRRVFAQVSFAEKGHTEHLSELLLKYDGNYGGLD